MGGCAQKVGGGGQVILSRDVGDEVAPGNPVWGVWGGAKREGGMQVIMSRRMGGVHRGRDACNAVKGGGEEGCAW